ncbi:hypothetical protein ACFUJR_39175 [Streptomyces sp. NPDC057271]|uniref:hypothetical protein n=1 Tax=unclassified Streptomyces TaxID=2593676 RepID=UPI0036352AC8
MRDWVLGVNVKSFARALASFSAVSALILTATGTAQAATAAPDATIVSVCYRAHVSGVGWESKFTCGGWSGTVGQNRAIEALQISAYGVGWFCAQAHTRNVGWGPKETCAEGGQTITIGTTGQNLPMEAIRFSSPRTVWANAHVQNEGYTGYSIGTWIEAGTTGKNQNLEALSMSFR